MGLNEDIQLGQIAEALNGKADLDMANINNAGKANAAAWAMPSGTYENLTWGASGTTYTMTADGWLQAYTSNSGSGNCYVALVNSTKGYRMQVQQPSNYGNPIVFLPVGKGDVVELYYQNISPIEFRFYYAVGAASDPSFVGNNADWTFKYVQLAKDITWSPNLSNTSYSLASYLPSDNYNYEVLVNVSITTGSTSGNNVVLYFVSSAWDTIRVCSAITRSSSAVYNSGTALVPILANDRNITVKGNSTNSASGTYNIYLNGYRRTGANI